MRYYDRDGNELEDEVFYLLFEDSKYKRVAETTILRNNLWVSTVWLGTDHNWSRNGPPLIFETLVFDKNGGMDDSMRRYSTEAEAIKGHEEVVQKYQDWSPDENQS